MQNQEQDAPFVKYHEDDGKKMNLKSTISKGAICLGMGAGACCGLYTWRWWEDVFINGFMEPNINRALFAMGALSTGYIVYRVFKPHLTDKADSLLPKPPIVSVSPDKKSMDTCVAEWKKQLEQPPSLTKNEPRPRNGSILNFKI